MPDFIEIINFNRYWFMPLAFFALLFCVAREMWSFFSSYRMVVKRTPKIRINKTYNVRSLLRDKTPIDISRWPNST